MNPTKQHMNRRTFLKRCVSLTTFSVCFKRGWLFNVYAAQPSTSSVAYGSGAYGQGSYPGSNHQIYLPIINKEEN